MTLSNNPSSSEREREDVFLSFIIIPVLETLSSHHFDGISLSLPRLLSLSLDLIFEIQLTIQLSLGNALFYCYCYSVSQLKTRKCMMCVGKKLTSIGIGNNSINRTIITSQRLEKMKGASRAQCENIA